MSINYDSDLPSLPSFSMGGDLRRCTLRAFMELQAYAATAGKAAELAAFFQAAHDAAAALVPPVGP